MGGGLYNKARPAHLPASHASQLVWPAASWCLPIAQSVHPVAVSSKVCLPAGQSVHGCAASIEKRPAPHAVQLVRSALGDRPAAHWMQLLVAPWMALYVPAGHACSLSLQREHRCIKAAALGHALVPVAQ